MHCERDKCPAKQDNTCCAYCSEECAERCLDGEYGKEPVCEYFVSDEKQCECCGEATVDAVEIAGVEYPLCDGCHDVFNRSVEKIITAIKSTLEAATSKGASGNISKSNITGRDGYVK